MGPPLAVELGLRLEDDWPDGVWLADLSKATYGRLVAAAVADAYGLAWITNDHRSTTGHFELARAEAAALLDGPVVPGPSLARLLAHTAGLHASAGNVQLAESRLARAEEILATAGSEDRWGKVTVTGGKTTVALYRRDRESLLDAVQRIEADLQDPSDPTARTDALWWLSMLRNALGEGDEIALATEAVELSRQTGDHVALVGALCAAAEYALRANDDVLAATHQREAMRLAAELRIHVYTAFSFIIAARLANERAQPDEAVLLHAAADVILARISFTLMPDDQELSDEMLATAREALGAERYATLQVEGQAMPVDRAVDMADQIFSQVVQG